MDRLQATVTAMVAHVQGLPPTPTHDQLKAKVTQLSDALTRDATSMAKALQDIVHSGFVVMGWDSRRRVVTKTENFSVAGLLDSLNKILTDLASHSADRPPVSAPSAAELGDLSLACNKLWELDANRLVPGQDYELNVQKGKKMWDEGDAASAPLFTRVDESVFTKKPTFAAFVALLDNYSAALGVTEVVDDHERRENRRFLEACMDTDVMQYVFQYLRLAGKTRSTTREQFVRELDALWFALYTRKRTNDSSGFEHVFVGEIKPDTQEIVGFHNWVQIYLQEKKGTFDYLGFIKPKRPSLPSRIPQDHLQLVSLQFKWGGALKKVSSSFIGTSPEFELGLYTLCFLMGAEDVVAQTGPYRVQITLHRWKQGAKEYIATSFPGEPPLDQDEAATRIQAQMRGKTAVKASAARR